jgi:RimJ/RimL family protein N-acetyltransferase
LEQASSFSTERALWLNRTIVSERLSLEPLLALHGQAMFEPLQAAALYTWISATPPATQAALAARWLRNESRLAPDGSSAWLAWAVRWGDELVGKLDAEITADNVASNVGYLFFVDHWGKGLASEAVRALSDRLIVDGVREQHATVTVGNHASCRVLEKCGFEPNGLLPANDVIRGVAHDDLAYVRRG